MTRATPTSPAPRPLLKWAGGKTQMLGDLRAAAPLQYTRYIEPFIGGGAFFFALQPKKAVIADFNPELVNLYTAVANNVQGVIACLKTYKNTSEVFYATRANDWRMIANPSERAARTIFLNRTCFNGLYRVNKSGLFNTPFGKYANPKILDEPNLRAASALLQRTSIREGDWRVALNGARSGDFIFLDPPYLPIEQTSNFTAYTKDGFSEQDHIDLIKRVHELTEIGCHVLYTNSNNDLVRETFAKEFKGATYDYAVIETRRNINRDPSKRTGQDVLVTARPRRSPTPKSTASTSRASKVKAA